VSAFKAVARFRGGSFKPGCCVLSPTPAYDQLRARRRRPTPPWTTWTARQIIHPICSTGGAAGRAGLAAVSWTP